MPRQQSSVNGAGGKAQAELNRTEKEASDAVLVAVTSITSTGLIRELSYEYPSVKYVWSLGDLIDKNFCRKVRR